MQNEELAKELAALFDRVNEPKPIPLPEQDTRVGEAMAGIADDRNRAEWQERVDRAIAGILKLIPAVLEALNTRPAPSGEEVEEARDILSALSSYLGAGLGDDKTTLAQFDDRIRWGIDHIGRVYRNRAAQVVEDCSKRPSTTWGTVKRAILEDTCLPTAQPAALRAGDGR